MPGGRRDSVKDHHITSGLNTQRLSTSLRSARGVPSFGSPKPAATYLNDIHPIAASPAINDFAMTMRRTSLVPSPIAINGASR